MRMPHLPRLLALALTLVATGLFVLPIGPAFARDPKLKVVTTVAPHADLVREIAGDRVDLVQMIPDGTDSHTFEPRPSDAAFLQAADLIILNGLHLETPTQRMADANKKADTPYLLLGDGTISPPDYLFDYSFPASKGDPNPHLWLNVAYAKNYAQLITNQLVSMDPANATYYQANFATLAGRMDQLDQSIFQAVQSLPENNRKLLTYHDSWAYFSRRYGMTVIGAIQPSDFGEPSPREVAALIDQIRANQLPAIFGSEVYPSKVMEVIGRETGANYVSSLRDDDMPGEPGTPKHTYLGMMLEDMHTMFGALGGRTELFDGIDPSPVAAANQG
ncbi:MAG: metal ABC transporter substrate-binding protein [Chloroflexota bacterium]|nr:metal ABC transporter substrate-binding protein [Chloroflexota bacterium]